MHLKLLIVAMSVFLFSACNHGAHDPAHADDASKVQTHQHDESADQHEETQVHELALNKGEKWKADENTRLQVAALSSLSDEFEKSADKGVETYHRFADNAQAELQKLIKGCTMKGPDHDALHLWLEPVLADVKNIKNSENLEEAKIAATTLFSNVRKFNQFFN